MCVTILRYNVRYSSQADLSLIRLKSINYGLNTLRYFGQKKWNVDPGDTEFSSTLPKIHKENTGNLEFVLEHSNEKVIKYDANNNFYVYNIYFFYQNSSCPFVVAVVFF